MKRQKIERFIIVSVSLLVWYFLFDELLCYDAKLVVPFFSEASYQRFSQELIEVNLAFCAKSNGFLTNVPTMIVQSSQRSQLLFANRVEVATDRLLLQEAALWPSESAIAALNDARHQFSFWVWIANALPVDDGLSTHRKLRPKVVELRFNVRDFIHRDWRSCISLFATFPMTGLDIATEVLRQDIRVQDDIAHLNEVTKRLVAGHAG